MKAYMLGIVTLKGNDGGSLDHFFSLASEKRFDLLLISYPWGTCSLYFTREFKTGDGGKDYMSFAKELDRTLGTDSWGLSCSENRCGFGYRLEANGIQTDCIKQLLFESVPSVSEMDIRIQIEVTPPEIHRKVSAAEKRDGKATSP